MRERERSTKSHKKRIDLRVKLCVYKTKLGIKAQRGKELKPGGVQNGKMMV